MNGLHQLVVFWLNGRRFGLRLTAVRRVVRAVEVTPLPEAPAIVLGVINVQGKLLPVFNLRKRLELPEREMELTDQMLIAQARSHTVALVADEITGVLDYAENDLVDAEKILPELPRVQGILKLADGLVLIEDLDRFLSLKEERTLEAAMSRA